MFKKHHHKHGSKGFDEKFTQLQTFITNSGSRIFGQNNSTTLTPQTYVDQIRREINKQLIEITLGCEFERSKKGNWEIKFKHHIPNSHELAKLSQLLSDFIQQYERPLLAAFVQNGMMDTKGNIISNVPTSAADAANMSIPDRAGTITMGITDPAIQRVAFMDKPTHKTIREAILGSSQMGYMNMYLQVTDLVIMAANGEKLKKHDKKKKMLIIGGIVIIVAGAVGVGMWLYTKKKKSAEEMATELEMSCEDISVDCEDLGGIDDAPVVTL